MVGCTNCNFVARSIFCVYIAKIFMLMRGDDAMGNKFVKLIIISLDGLETMSSNLAGGPC